VPFFILAGELMNSGGITGRIVRFSQSLVAHVRGGLAQVNILSSMLFAGISGSAVADASAIGKMMVPAMERNGYSRGFAAAVTAFAVLALRFVYARALLPAWLVVTVVVAPLTYATIFGVLVPRMEALWLSPRLAAATVEVSGCADPAVISAGNGEASLIFSVGTDIRFGDGAEAADFLAGDGCRAAIVESREEEAFTAQLAASRIEPKAVRRIEGINIANGRRLDFGVYGVSR